MFVSSAAFPSVIETEMVNDPSLYTSIPQAILADRGSRTMSRPDLVLVTGAMVGASSWRPTADRLRASGWRVHVPDVLATSGTLPPWRELSLHYAGLLSPEAPPILVGHSLATTVVADLVARMPVRGLTMVYGETPPESGPVAPGRDSFRQFVASLADRDGRLPRWSDWWRDHPRRPFTGIDELANDADAFAMFEKDQPRVSWAWFEDMIDLAPWAHIPSGYIQTSAFYDHAADEAQRRGWPVVRIKGTHLHPTLQPDETAAAIQEICGQFVGNNRD
jgi:Alpha/beta hydrolase family